MLDPNKSCGPDNMHPRVIKEIKDGLILPLSFIYIKTHDSESRGQEAAVRDERVSYLQVAPLKNSQTL